MIKKIVILLLCMALLFLAACAQAPIIEVVKPNDRPDKPSIEDPDKPDKPLKTIEPVGTIKPLEPIESDPPLVTMLPTPTPAPTPSGPTMYTSYAFMVSYDPSTNVAEFDYWDMLKGEDAVDWLVDHEGWSQVDAENEVAGWGDGEHITKNTNPQLRSIDLDDQQLTLMYNPADVPAFEVGGVSSDSDDADALYAMNPAYLFSHFFFYIHVSGGVVTHVEQIYWV